MTTSDRGETLHSMNITKRLISDNSISFITTNKLKTIKWVLKLKIVKCVNSYDQALDVCAYVKCYMLETSKFRDENHDDLFLSWVTKRSVTKVTGFFVSARWLKSVLSLSGIVFFSCRHKKKISRLFRSLI